MGVFASILNTSEAPTHLFFSSLHIPEEILDDGVGLFVESSGDSLDDDSEIFSESECSKVSASTVYYRKCSA